MYIDDFYTPSTQLGFEPDFSGYIPDQNMQPYESPYDLQFDRRLQRDLTQQLQDYIQRQKPVETKRKPKDYIVIDSGNTLSQLANEYNTTVEDLARLNGIKDINKIKAGQVLRLNNKVSNKYRDYTYTNRTRKPVRNTNAQSVSTNARNYADEAVITAPIRTAPIRSVNVNQKSQVKPVNTNKYKDYTYTNNAQKSTRNANARNYSDEAVITSPRRTATRRSVNINQKSQIKSVNTNKYSTNIDQSQQIPIVQYTPKSNKNYQNSIRKRNKRRTTTQTSKPRSFFDVILNTGRSINQENKRERQRLEEYDRNHPRQNR